MVPMKHKGERRCNSGCVTRDGKGRPMIFYTWVPSQGGVKRSQWAALPTDDELRHWQRVGDAPLMTAGEDGVPAAELEKLRGAHTRTAGLELIEGVRGRQLEVAARFAPGSAGAFGLKLRSSADGGRAITLRCSGGTLDVAGTAVPLGPAGEQKTLDLRVFLDRSVMEVFINGGRAAVTRVEYPAEEDQAVGVFAEDGKATLLSLDAWEMRSVWEQ